MAPFNPRDCPLCGGDNRCVRQGSAPDSPCWCRDEKFSTSLLARVPDEAKRKACICRNCVRESQREAAIPPPPPG